MEGMPTSFGVFKPVGHVMMGLPSQAQVEALADALHRAGWSPDTLLHFTPSETLEELDALVDGAGMLAGFGCEITLLRRYVKLARQGCRWLLVKVKDTDQASVAADLAKQAGAALAVHYRTLTVEDLI